MRSFRNRPRGKVMQFALYLLIFGIAALVLLFSPNERGNGETNTGFDISELLPPAIDDPAGEQTGETDQDPVSPPSPITSVVGIFTADRLPREFADISETDALYALELDFYLPEEYSLRQRTRRVLTVTEGEGDSQDYAVLTEITEDRPSVETYMGYLLVDDGENILLCSTDGTPLFRYSPDDYTPAYERDSGGNPLFVHYIDSSHKVYYVASDGGFIESDYNPATDSRGLSFDYPADYGTGDGYPRIIRSDGDRGAIFAVDVDGNQLFDPHTAYYNEHGRYVDCYYLPPLTDGLESIGFYYFDHGYTRVRRQVIDHYNYFGLGQIKVVSDEDILVSAEGNVFPLPNGYSLAGYSEGMLLLEKDGMYGFTDCTGEWIAQPIFTSATPFIGGFATLTAPDGRVGMIDRQGNIVLPFAYRSISVNSGGVIAAYSETYGWEVFEVRSKK